MKHYEYVYFKAFPGRPYHWFWVSELQLIPKIQGIILLLSNIEVWSDLGVGDIKLHPKNFVNNSKLLPKI